MKETLYDQQVLSTEQNRYFRALSRLAFVDQQQRYHYQAKDSTGNEVWKELTPAEKQSLRKHVMFNLWRGYQEYGGDKRDATGLVTAGKEYQLKQGVALVVRL